MAFDQTNQSSHRPVQQVPPPAQQQQQVKQTRTSPSLPPMASEEWEYNGYNNNRPGYPASSYAPPHNSPPQQQQQHQVDYANRTSAYPSSSPPHTAANTWEQVCIYI